jgi:5-methylcytosine-specific restriction endonuclease McrA
MENKYCNDCEETKPVAEFYERPNYNNSDAVYYLPYCKECAHIRAHAYQKTKKGKLAFAKGSKKWAQTQEGKQCSKKALAKYRRSERGKEYAQSYEQRDYVKERHRIYTKSAAGKISSANYVHGRRRSIQQSGYRLTVKDWDEIQKAHDHCCAYCHKPTENPTIDHIVPLSRGGLHAYDNIAPACGKCNRSKGPRLLSEWKGRITSEFISQVSTPRATQP